MAVAHPEPFTVDELFALPEDGMRHELYDGALLVTPPPGMRHGRVVGRLRTAFAAQLPPDLVALENIGVLLTPSRLLVPDLVVLADALTDSDAPHCLARDVRLVVEVQSPSTAAVDRTLKLTLYAEAGISLYLRVVPAGREPGRLHLHRLVAGSYATESVAAGGTLTLPEPFGVALEAAELFD